MPINESRRQDFSGRPRRGAQTPVKANSLAENQARSGGATKGHRGVGRQVFSKDEADERRVAKVEAETCETCECRLNRLSSNERGVYEFERERIKKIYYEVERKICRKSAAALLNSKNTRVESLNNVRETERNFQGDRRGYRTEAISSKKHIEKWDHRSSI